MHPWKLGCFAVSALTFVSLSFAQASWSESGEDVAVTDDLIPQEEIDLENALLSDVSAEPMRRVLGKEQKEALTRRVQIVVHKTMRETGRQYMEVFRDGDKVHTFTVSTAWERRVKAKGIDPATGRTKVYNSSTPNGVFVIDGMQAKRFSNTWQVWLKYVLRFSGGVWIHATTPDHYAELGAPASGGCVRVHEDDARVLYDLVNAVGLDNVAITILPPAPGELQIKPKTAPGRLIEQ